MTIDLDDLEDRAKHQLEGPCTGMAREVLELVAEIRKLRADAAKGYPCDNCEIHCEYEGEPMTSCWLERVANTRRF